MIGLISPAVHRKANKKVQKFIFPVHLERVAVFPLHEEHEDVNDTNPSCVWKNQEKSKDKSGNMLKISATENNLTKAVKNWRHLSVLNNINSKNNKKKQSIILTWTCQRLPTKTKINQHDLWESQRAAAVKTPPKPKGRVSLEFAKKYIKKSEDFL